MTQDVTVDAVTPRVRLVADGVATDFDYPFLIFERDDLEVYLDEGLQKSGYQVSGVGKGDGGYVRFDDSPTADTIVTLRRKLTLQRTSDFQEGSKLRAEALNSELDFQTAALQDLESEQVRSLRFHPSHPDADAVLPAATSGKALIWNQVGDGLINGPDAIEIADANDHATAALQSRNAAQSHADRAETALTGFYETASSPTLEMDFANEEARLDEDERKSPANYVDGVTRVVDLREAGQVFQVINGGSIQLPSIADAGNGFRLFVVRADHTGTVTVQAEDSDLIKDLGRSVGVSQRVLTGRGEQVEFVSDGSVWLAESGAGNAGPLFRALRTAKQVLSVGTDTVVAWDSIIDDSHHLWDAANSELVGVPPGKYLVTIRLYLAMTTQDMELKSYLERKSGVTWYRHRDHVTWVPDASGRFWTVSWSAVISAGDGEADQFRLVLRHDDTTPREIAASDLHSAIEMIRVGL